MLQRRGFRASCLLVALLAATARAEEKPPTSSEAADEVLKVWEAKDAAALKALAARDKPDPWLVADKLCARGEHDAAEAFAQAAPRADVEALPGYVASRRDTTTDEAARAAYKRAYEAWSEKDFEGVLAELEGVSGDGNDVFGISVLTLRASALSKLKRHEAAHAARLAAVAQAERLGWLAKASHLLWSAGQAVRDRSRAEHARELYQRALVLFRRRGDRASAAAMLINIGNRHLEGGSLDAAIDHFERGLAEAEAVNHQRWMLKGYMNLGFALLRQSRWDRALSSFERAPVLAEALGDPTRRSRGLRGIGLARFGRGEHDRAMRAYEDALALARKTGNAVLTARIQVDASEVHAARGEFTKAIGLAQAALGVLEAEGSLRDVAWTLSALGVHHQYSGDSRTARALQKRCLALNKRLGDELAVAKAVTNLGVAEMRLGRTDRALTCFEEGRELFAKLGDRSEHQVLLVNFASLHLLRGEFRKARSLYEEALALAEEVNSVRGVASALQGLISLEIIAGRYEEAEARIDRARRHAEACGARHLLAAAAGDAARLDAARGRYGPAREHYESAIAAAEAAGLPGEAAGYSKGLADVYLEFGHAERAIPLLERAIAMLDERGDARSAFSARLHLANAFDQVGLSGHALELYRRLRWDAERHGYALMIALAIENEGCCLSSMLRHEEALACCEDALTLFSDMGADGHLVVARTNLALELAGLGRFPEALAFQQGAWRQAEDQGSPVGVAQAWATLGVIRRRMGEHAQALAAFQRALSIHESLGRLRDVALIRQSIGEEHLALGNFAEGVRHLEGSIAVAEGIGNEGLAAEGSSAVGLFHSYLGNADLAVSYLRSALKRHPGGAAGGVRTRTALARQLGIQGKNAEARAELESLLEEPTGRLDADLRALVLGELGRTLLDLGRPAEALACLEEALAVAEEGGDPHAVVRIRGTVAAVHAHEGRLAEAIRLHAEDVESLRALGDRRGVGWRLRRLAELHRATGDLDAAVRHAEAAVRSDLSLGKGLGDWETLGLRRNVREGADVGLLVCRDAMDPAPGQQGEHLARAHWFLEAARALSLAGGLANRSALLEREVPEELLAAEAAARSDIRDLNRRLMGTAEPRVLDVDLSERIAVQLDDAYRRLAVATGRIQREARRVAQVVCPEPLELASLREALMADEGLVLYHLAGHRLHGFVITDAGVRLVDLGDAGTLEEEVRSYLRLAAVPGSDERRAAAALNDRLLRPLEPAIGDRSRLLVSPDGPLTFLPFEALVRVDGEERERAIERWEIAYVPSGTVYASLLEDARGQERGVGLVALGDPVYPGEVRPAAEAAPVLAARAAELRGLGSLRRLPYSGEEVRAVGDLFPEERRTVLVREDATTSRVRAELDGVEGRLAALHLACHGHVDTERPMLTGLVLGGGEVLTLNDVYRLEVPADLVVLSACESGRGRWEHGEGVMGLVRGFFYAGAPRVVVSNWQVNDESTKALMAAFYRHHAKGGLPASAALRRAKLEMLRAGGEHAHPHHWAPFVLWGLPD